MLPGRTALQMLTILLAGTSAVPVASRQENTVVLLHVLFRHGNRTPDKISLYPNDPYINETYAPIGLSQLTPKGKSTEFAIGQYIRSTYGQLIPAQYTANVVYGLSTNFKRTKMSLELVLTGLFPPPSSTYFNQIGFNWQPIPFDIETGQGLLGVAALYCPVYISAYYGYLLSQNAQQISDQYKELFQELEKYAGLPVKYPRDAAGIYFALKSEDDYGLKLPAWTNQYYPKVLEDVGSIDYEFSTATPTLRRLSAGFLLQKILSDSLAKQNGTLPNETKVFLYSAHEYNVATMLTALNVFYRHIPPFGATIYFEVHNVQGVYGLKLYYQAYTSVAPKLLTIPGCDSFCPLEQVYQLVQENLPGENDVCTPNTEIF